MSDEPNAAVDRACAKAEELATIPWSVAAPADAPPPTRFVAMGDPQTSCRRMFELLATNDLLGSDGMLAPDVGLISVGDHFDYPFGDCDARTDVGHEGIKVLRWLAEHDPGRVPILLGNHDSSRVMELVGFDDHRFEQAYQRAMEIRQLDGAAAREASADFAEGFGPIPTPGIASRDFSSYSTHQRALVMALLRGKRMRLGWPVSLVSGGDALVTHAGITTRELSVLDPAPPADPQSIATALNRVLDREVERVKDSWNTGEPEPLDLAPLHRAGIAGAEGGGMLYHRPANPDAAHRPDANLTWEQAAGWNRRYDPRHLPIGLAQICGHSSHKSCKRELVPWVHESASQAGAGALRTLQVEDGRVSYRRGVAAHSPTCGTVYMIDGGMATTSASDYQLLRLSSWTSVAVSGAP